MIYLQFTLGALMYSLIAYISYSPVIKSSPWFYPLGLTGALIANLLWLWISKTESVASNLAIKGIFWDVMLTLVYLAIPLLLFGVRLSNVQIFGILLILTGLIMVKL